MGPPYSLRIPRVHRYSGFGWSLQNFVYRTITVFGQASQPVRLSLHVPYSVHTPVVFLPPVWPLPISLATTFGISFDFSSSAYLDVSVRRVPFRTLWIHARIHGSSPWGFPHSEICGSSVYFQLTAAYRRLSRPSSALGAKAFILCSFSLEQLRFVLFLNKLCFIAELSQIVWVV